MRLRLYDAGTTLVIDSSGTTPGMDSAYYRGLNMEYDFKNLTERVGQINADLRTTPVEAELRPWPVPFPGRCWLDLTGRYEGADGGPVLSLHHRSPYSGEYDPVPAPYCQIENAGDYRPLESVNSERMADTLEVDEVAARNPAPTEWLRLPLHNEVGGRYGGQVDLKQPAVAVYRGTSGPDFRLQVDYNDLFMPVDLTHPEWYDAVGEDGELLPEADKARYLALHSEGFYRLYLRPANWRWVAHVYAHYVYVSWFELFRTTLGFTRAWFDRPPVYPYRHDLLHTTQNPWWEYLHAYYSLDPGISDAFNSSNGAAELRYEIIDQQWYTQSEAFIFSGNDEATCVLWKYPPNVGDFVCGIGRVNHPGGDAQTVWLRQRVDVYDTYPPAVIGQYAILDFVVAT